jgi:hypothetical protein
MTSSPDTDASKTLEHLRLEDQTCRRGAPVRLFGRNRRIDERGLDPTDWFHLVALIATARKLSGPP